MKHTKANHFWHWFKCNQQHYVNFTELPTSEQRYWMAELKAHVAAYDRFLHPVLFCSIDRENKRCRLVISAAGRSKSFAIADRLIGKAPSYKRWDFGSLMPPGGLEDWVAGKLKVLNLDRACFSFDVRVSLDGRRNLYVYVDTTEDVRSVIEDLADRAVYNLLGERVFAQYFGYVEAARRSDALPGNLPFLAPLNQLPDLISAKQLSGKVVDMEGKLVKQ